MSAFVTGTLVEGRTVSATLPDSGTWEAFLDGRWVAVSVGSREYTIEAGLAGATLRYVYGDEVSLPTAVVTGDGARHNTAPVVTGAPGWFILSEGPGEIGPVRIFDAVRVDDPDHEPFKGGELTVAFLDGIAGQPLSFDFVADRRFVYDAASGAISYEPASAAEAGVIGFLDAPAGSSLHVTFTKDASCEAVAALIRSVAYGAADFDLPTNGYFALGFVLVDAKGAAAQGATGISEFDSSAVALTGIQPLDAAFA